MFYLALTKIYPLGLIYENLYCKSYKVCSFIGSFSLSFMNINLAYKLLTELYIKI